MAMKVDSLTITRPDDWHLHLRAGEPMHAVLPETAKRFGRAIIMPNLKPPVTTVASAVMYQNQILMMLPKGSAFDPLMTLYLTDNTPPSEVDAVKASGFVHAIKLYPAGATTNSDAGVSDIKKCMATIARMEKLGVPLLVHGEVTDPAVDIFDREAVFIDTILIPLLRDFPALKVSLEHITTREGVDFVRAADSNVAGTLTAHHLLMNRNAIFTGGLRAGNYCLPVAKREMHRQALVAAAISGNPKFFLGTDSAPHASTAKYADCGCAGCYTAYAGIELYAEAFEAAGALDKLEGFASFHGADWYGLPRNEQTITLIRKDWMPGKDGVKSYPFGEGEVVIPWRPDQPIRWQLVAD
jgi:dihydroorotase